MFITIAGNIGAGKSTWCEALSAETGLPVYTEPWQENPHLAEAYANPVEHRGPAAEWFVMKAIEQHQQIIQTGGIHDRGVDEHVGVFAEYYRSIGYIDSDTMLRISNAYTEHLHNDRPCDMMVYLQTTPDLAAERIRARGRDMETVIDEELLGGLHTHLETMVNTWNRSPLLVIEPYELDELPEIIRQVVEQLPPVS